MIARGYRGFPPEALIVGDVERTAAAFGELAAIGYDEVVVRHLVQDPGRVLDSIGRLAEVKAALRR